MLKKLMKHLFVFAGITTAGLLMSCSESETQTVPKIGVSVPAPTHGWASGVVWNAEQSSAELKRAGRADVSVVTAKNSGEQIAGIENMLMQGVKALVVMSQDPVPLLNVCKRAKQQGVFLVIVSNPLTEPVQDVFVNGDNRSFGVAAAHAMAQSLPDRTGKILLLRGNPCPIDNERVNGFTETLEKEYPGITILASADTNWSAEKGQSVMELMLQQHPAIDGVWAGDDDVLSGVLKAYERSKRKDIKVLVGGGGAQNVIRMLTEKDSPVKATVTYPPDMISAGIQAAADALSGKDPQKEIIIPSRIINRQNAGNFLREGSPY